MLFRPKNFTLGSFIPKASNQCAVAVGIRFVSAQRAASNTLVITGYSCSGKTHLINALARFAMRNQEIDGISCLTAMQFFNEVARGNFYGDLDIVIERFVQVGLLAIDDVEHTLIQPEVADVLLAIMQLRQTAKNRTLLTSTLYLGMARDHPITHFLDDQVAVRLT